jgi:hypothetical protein
MFFIIFFVSYFLNFCIISGKDKKKISSGLNQTFFFLKSLIQELGVGLKFMLNWVEKSCLKWETPCLKNNVSFILTFQTCELRLNHYTIFESYMLQKVFGRKFLVEL